MTDFNFHSTDPDNYNEVKCPVIYTGVSPRVRWYINDITTNHHIIVANPLDYITFSTNADFPEEDQFTIHLKRYYTEITPSFMDDVNELLHKDYVNLTLKQDNRNIYYFEHSTFFWIVDMSYNLKQILGFYYMSFPLECKLLASTYFIYAKSVGFSNLTPVWFLISNLGQPIQINKEENPWTPLFPAIVMKIQNSFQPAQPLTYSNSDYISVSPPAALSNLRVKLVDSNLVPIKLLNPLYVSVSLQEITEDEKQPYEEAMSQQESNPETQKTIQQTVIKYNTVKNTNQQKVEAGITQEPLADVMMIQTEVQLANDN